MARSELIRPLPDLLRAHATRRGDKVAFADARRAVTYAELERRTAWLAGHLTVSYTHLETIESYLTAVRAGGVGVPVHPRTSADELAYLLDDSGAQVVITDATHLDQLRAVAADRAGLTVVVAGTTSGWPPPNRPPRPATTSHSTRWRGCSTPRAPPAAPRACCPPRAAACGRWPPATCRSSGCPSPTGCSGRCR